MAVDRSRTYGFPDRPISGQTKVNEILRRFTRDEEVKRVGLIGRLTEEKATMRLIGRKIESDVRQLVNLLEGQDKGIPPFWLEHGEIKELPKEKQEGQGNELMQSLAHKKQMPSISAGIFYE